MGDNQRPTQHDIAKHLGVSQITVSRALSGHAAVTKQMRERVEAAADELGYRPHASAAAMRRGKHNAFGLLASTDPHSSSFPMEMMWFLHDAAARHGRRLIIGRLPPEKLRDKQILPHFLREWSVDGLIAHFPKPPSPELADMLTRSRLPMVSINSDIPHSIMPDDYAAGKQATQRFIAAGHSKIAYVGPIDGHSSTTERLRGYEAAMKKAGLKIQVFDLGDWDKRYKRNESALAILNNPHRPTAVFCYGHWIALNFLIAAERLGIHVPDQLSIIGVAQTTFPNAGLDIDIERIPLEEMADIAIEQLVKIENGELPESAAPVPFTSHKGETIALPPTEK